MSGLNKGPSLQVLSHVKVSLLLQHPVLCSSRSVLCSEMGTGLGTELSEDVGGELSLQRSLGAGSTGWTPHQLMLGWCLLWGRKEPRWVPTAGGEQV